ncbi:4Fe-4S binding protein [Sulfurimonas sp. SAG-AH-194-I05]|nr:4Fe-4S binding protein [Sulfurimonas sp. SAG-AH-194-I05]MDF1874454.1 4Fe-4S binding protein [Sulfurimonas sp. SAG-AH-194-I05]
MNKRELFGFLSSSLKGEAFTKKELIIRPPYFNDILSFDIHCKNCDALCAKACQEQIIIIQKDKTPHLDFSKSGCTYCDDCAEACVPSILQVDYKTKIDVGVTINESTCMSWSGVMCFSCKDPCLEDAIDFKAMFMPTINHNKCTSCGFCISRCPSYAILIK